MVGEDARVGQAECVGAGRAPLNDSSLCVEARGRVGRRMRQGERLGFSPAGQQQPTIWAIHQRPRAPRPTRNPIPLPPNNNDHACRPASSGLLQAAKATTSARNVMCTAVWVAVGLLRSPSLLVFLVFFSLSPILASTTVLTASTTARNDNHIFSTFKLEPQHRHCPWMRTMAYRLSSGAVIEPSSVILAIQPEPGVTEAELVGRNVGRVGHHQVSDAHVSPFDFHDEAVIVLSLSHPPRLGEHFVLGSDAPTTDIVLGVPGRHVSARHLRFGFDEQDRVIMLDSSTLGTSVAYDGQPSHSRRGTPGSPFRWVLPAGHRILVQIGSSFKFHVFVQDHRFHHEEFRAKLESFRDECRLRVPELSDIDLAADPLATASALTPASLSSGLPNSATVAYLETLDDEASPEPEMYVEGRILGRGGNGTVNEFYAVRDWARYAGKRGHP